MLISRSTRLTPIPCSSVTVRTILVLSRLSSQVLGCARNLQRRSSIWKIEASSNANQEPVVDLRIDTQQTIVLPTSPMSESPPSWLEKS